MKKTFLFIALLTMIATSAIAQDGVDGGGSFIGMFWDDQALTCGGDVLTYVPVDLYIYTSLNTDVVSEITAAEFSCPNMPESNGYPDGTMTVTWTTSLVIGDLFNIEDNPDHNVALAWDGEQIPFSASNGAALVLLGTMEILDMADGGWPGTDIAVTFEASTDNEHSQPVLVDLEYIQFLVAGGTCFINGEGDCLPSTATDVTNWSHIKSLY